MIKEQINKKLEDVDFSIIRDDLTEEQIEYILTQNRYYVEVPVIKKFKDYLTKDLMTKHIYNFDELTGQSYILDYLIQTNGDTDSFINIYPKKVFTCIETRHLPKKIRVIGDLNLFNTNITSLPDNLHVGGDLDLSNTNITSLPENLHVGGSLNLFNTNITSLPDNLHVGGSLNLSNTKITSLPDNLYVGGFLYLENTNITYLPDNLYVGGSLNLRYTKITSLPDNLYVGEDLYLNDLIQEIPESCVIKGKVYDINYKIII